MNWKDPEPNATLEYLNQAKSLYSFMEPYVSKNPRSAFLNYRDLDIGINSFGENSYQEGKVYGAKYFNNKFIQPKTSLFFTLRLALRIFNFSYKQ